MKTKEEIGPIVRRKLTSDVASKVISLILDGYWLPGQQLPSERELSIQMGVGRTSLREGLKALEIMGLIEVRVGEGTFVKKKWNFFGPGLISAIYSSKEKIKQLIEARKLLEVKLAEWAAKRRSSDDLRQIAESIDAMEAAGKDNDLFLEADLRFHVAISQASHNEILSQVMEMIRQLLKEWIRLALNANSAGLALEQHKRIFMAITKQDPVDAQSSMAKHLDDMADILMKRLVETTGVIENV